MHVLILNKLLKVSAFLIRVQGNPASLAGCVRYTCPVDYHHRPGPGTAKWYLNNKGPG